VKELLRAHFDVETVGQGEQCMRDTWDRIEAEGSQDHRGSDRGDGVWQTARFRSPQLMEQLCPDHGREWRGLAVSISRGRSRELVPEGVGGQPQCRYVHLAGRGSPMP